MRNTALQEGGQRSPDRWVTLQQGLGELERNPASVTLSLVKENGHPKQ